MRLQGGEAAKKVGFGLILYSYSLLLVLSLGGNDLERCLIASPTALSSIQNRKTQYENFQHSMLTTDRTSSSQFGNRNLMNNCCTYVAYLPTYFNMQPPTFESFLPKLHHILGTLQPTK